MLVNSDYHVNNWYSLIKCEYPKGYYRLLQHAFVRNEGASIITSTTNICEGDLQALKQITKQQQLDCII